MSIRRQNRQSERAGDELHPLLLPSSNPQLIFSPGVVTHQPSRRDILPNPTSASRVVGEDRPRRSKIALNMLMRGWNRKLRRMG